MTQQKRAPSRQRLASDAAFAPHRDECARLLRETYLSPEDIVARLNCRHRHIKEVADEIGMDLYARGIECQRQKKQATRRAKFKALLGRIDEQLLRQHLNDSSLSALTLMQIHDIDRPTLHKLAHEMGFDMQQRTREYLNSVKYDRDNADRELEMVNRYTMRRESLSGDGLSLKWLQQPWSMSA
jgi:hypothetical protein